MDDLNVDNYNILDIFDLVDVPEYEYDELLTTLDSYIEAYTNENNIILTNFILQIKEKVVDFIQSMGIEYNEDSINVNSGEYIMNNDDEVVPNIIVKSNISLDDIPDNDNLINMNEEVASNLTYSGYNEIKDNDDDDNINFTQMLESETVLEESRMKNINQFEEDYVEKVLIFNSEFRKQGESINDYLLDLAEPLQNVTSIKLTSYTLTYNIYNIDHANSTNFLYITDSNFVEHLIKVKSGFYNTPQQLLTEINTSIQSYFGSLTYSNSSMRQFQNNKPVEFMYDELNGKISIYVSKPSRDEYSQVPQSDGAYVIYITFFNLQNSSVQYNFNLGYFLGFRKFYLGGTSGIGYYLEYIEDESTEGLTDVNNSSYTNIFVSNDGSFNVIESEGIIDLKHPKYLMLSLDEFNQNRSNTNVIQANDGTNNLVRDVISRLQIPRNPRRRPLAHIYAHNERIVSNINELRKQQVRNYPKTIPDTFADIPFPSDITLGTLVNNQGQNTVSIPPRKYFGPINIKRFRVRLFDDKGNLVNLNNTDYSFNVAIKMLYNKNVLPSEPVLQEINNSNSITDQDINDDEK